MKNKIMMFIAFIIFAGLSLLGVFSTSKITACIGIMGSLLSGILGGQILNDLDTHGMGLKLWWQHLKYYNKPIRISFSYLFRINIDGKYLLVRGHRLKNQYQPIGGVYKYKEEAKRTLNRLNYKPDTKMENHEDATDDLRIELKGKNILKFMDWFLSMEDREYDPYREFREELITKNRLLPEEEFRSLNYRKLQIHNEGITYSSYLKCNEYVYADIFEIKLTEKQKDIIRKAVEEHSDQLCLATADEIERECHAGLDKNLGNNCKWLL